MTITAVALQADPCDPYETALVVGGTTSNDTILFDRQGNSGDIVVYINDVLQGVFHPTAHVIAYGQSGDDDIQVASSIVLDALLYGDGGNDHLKGGGGANLLLGGDGNDQLNGGTGRNILIGGSGADHLVGSSGEDILIGGTTIYDRNAQALCVLLNGWKPTVDGYTVRVTRLRLFLNGDTVLDDGEGDLLIGSSGLDWFLSGDADVITIAQDGEIIG